MDGSAEDEWFFSSDQLILSRKVSTATLKNVSDAGLKKNYQVLTGDMQAQPQYYGHVIASRDAEDDVVKMGWGW